MRPRRVKRICGEGGVGDRLSGRKVFRALVCTGLRVYLFPVTRAPETRGVAHRSGSFTNLDHRLGFQGLAGDHRVDSGGLWGVGRVEGQPSSVGRGRFAAFRHQVDKTRCDGSPAIRGWETHRHTRRARASATLRPKLMEAADMERAAMVSCLRTTALKE